MFPKRNLYLCASMLLFLAAWTAHYANDQRTPNLLRTGASIIRRKLHNRRLTTPRRSIRSLILLIIVFCTCTMSCLAQADQRSPTDTSGLPYKYVGNSFSLKFHRPSCRYAKAMNVHHVQLFHYRREAIEAGEKPCNYCLPQSWGSVQAFLKPHIPDEPTPYIPSSTPSQSVQQ
jgi:hypothetical protein